MHGCVSGSFTSDVLQSFCADLEFWTTTGGQSSTYMTTYPMQDERLPPATISIAMAVVVGL